MRSALCERILAIGCLLLLACQDSTTDADAAVPDGGSADVGVDADIDMAGPDTPPASACAQVVGGPQSGRHVLRFERESPFARVHLLRRYARVAAGESAIYELLGMWVERDGGCVAITDAGALSYTNSHHNWGDRAGGAAGGVQYQLAMDLDLGVQSWKIELSGTAPGSSAALFDPIRLQTTGGPIGLANTPSRMPVYVTELGPANTQGWKDDAGEHEPWIELWNPSSEAVDIGGWSLSDDPRQRRRWSFPAGTVIGRHQYLVIAADGQPDQGPLHASFRLSPTGGSIVLTDGAGLTGGERSYSAVAANRSLLFSTASDGFQPGVTVTPGSGAGGL